MNARLRARLALLATAALLLPAVPAAAARVVQVRVGEHPGFTRVVFELDAPAGYRVERKAGSAELVVTLDAASGARKYSRKSSDIRAVEVEAAERAVARVRLSNPKLQLKEMILSNPPRIVLDVLREKPVVAVAKPAPKPKPAAETAAAKPKPAAEAKPAVETKTATAPKPAVEPKPATEAKPVPAPKPAPESKPIAKTEPPPAPKPIAKAEPAPTPKPAPEAKPAPATKLLAEAKPPAPTPPAIPAKPPAPTPALVAETKPSAAKPAAEPKPPALPEKPADAPKPVAELKPPAPKAEAPAPATPIAEAPKPAATPVPTPPSAKPVMTADDLAKLVAAKSAEQADEMAAAKPTTPTTPPGATTTPAPTTPRPALPTPPPGAVVEVAKPLPAPAPAKPLPAPAKTTPAAKPGAEPKASASSWLSNPIVLGAAAGVLLCVVGLVFLLRRRRALPNDLDVTAIAEEHGDAEAAGAVYAGTGSTDDDAFSLFDGDESTAAQEPATAPVSRSAAPAPAPDSNEDSEASFASLFDDDESHGPTVTQGAATMNQPTTSDFPMDRPAADRTAATVASPRSASAVPGADVMRLVQDLERRMSLLEKKLGESNEAREKLERQVAAQSEELRVQRAAIARTQRALRTMTRGEEDKATEPALREDPSGQTQSKTRINL